MNRFILSFFLLLFIFSANAQVLKTIEITAGGLSAALTTSEKSTVTDLIITGTLDARDFRVMRDSMALLANVDISATSVLAYTGNKGTEDKYPYGTIDFSYNANALPQYAFSWNNGTKAKKTLKTIKLPTTITGVGKEAFHNCSGLTSVEMSGLVVSIDESAFRGCSVVKIELPSTLVHIGAAAFKDSWKIESLTIPASVSYIGLNAFSSVSCNIDVDPQNPYYCSEDGVLFNKQKTLLIQFPTGKTGEYIIPSTVKVIGNRAFTLSTISSVIFPAGLDSIGDVSFWGSSKLSVLEIPSAVTYIGESAFANMTRLKTFTLPPLLKKVTNNMLGMNDNLSTVIFNTAVDTIESLAFQNCPSLKFLSFPASVKAICRDAFNNYTGITALYFASSTPFTVIDSLYMLDLFFKSPCTLYIPVGSTAAYKAAYWWKSFSKIVESSFNPIVESTAGNLSGLVPASVRSSLVSMVVSGTIDARDFQFMRDSLTAMKTLNLQSATINAYTGTAGTCFGKSVSYSANAVPVYAFCDSLKTSVSKTTLNSIVFPSAATVIGKKAFMNCDGLSTVWFSPAVRTIAESAFESCDNLSYATFSTGLTTIEKSAFYWCEVLQTINIPNTVTSLGEMAFYLCDDATSLTLSSSLEIIPRRAFGACRQIKSVVVPSSVKVLSDGAFASCSRMVSIEIPHSVTTIGPDVFSFCSALASVTIPTSVTSIGNSAFFYCTALTDIYAQNPVPVDLSASTTVFKSVNTAACTLHVPYGSKAAYQAADQWKDFLIEEGTPIFAISDTAIHLGEEGGIIDTISIIATVSWSITVNQPWVTVTPAAGSGDAVLHISMDANLEHTDRTATITVSPETGEPSTILVTQAAAIVKALSVSVNEVSIGSSAGSTTSVEVASNISWKAVSDQTWLSVTPSGATTGNASLTFRASANPTITERTAHVSVAGAGVDTVWVTVTQNAGAPTLLISSSTVSVSYAEGSTASVNVTSNTTWSASSNEEWLLVSPDSNTGNGKLTLTASVNPGFTSRQAVVSIMADGVASKTIVVTQQASPFLNADTLSLTFDKTMSVDSVEISSNISWSAVSNSVWLTVTPSSGSGNKTMVITADENTTIEKRVAEVTLSGSGLDNWVITITQAAGDPFVQTSENILLVGYIAGSSASVEITSNSAWAASSNQSWLAVSPSSASGNATVTFTAEANSDTVSRSAEVVFETTGTLPDTVRIVQAAKPYLSLETDTLYVGKQGAEVLSLNVNSNTTWQVANDDSWLALSSSTGEGSGTVTFSAEANPTVLQRTSDILFSANGIETQLVKVIQLAGDTLFAITPDDVLLDVAGGSSATITITSNIAWNASADQLWLSVSASEGEGCATLALVATENSSSEVRSATVIIEAGAIVKTILVTQKANKILEVSATALSIAEDEGSTASVAVTSNVSWTIAESADWLTVTPGMGTGDKVLVFTASENPESTDRSTIVTITSPDAASVSITVTQVASAPVLNVSATLISMAPGEGSFVLIDIVSNTDWTITTEQSWLTIDPASGFGNATVRLTGEANTTNTDRPAVLVISATGVESKVLNVIQISNVAASDIAGEEIRIYPNPVTTGFLLEGISGSARVTVTDISGRVCLEKEFMDREFVSTEELSQGVYFVKINDRGKEIIRKITRK